MSLTQIGLEHYLLTSALLFSLGLAIVVIRRNAVIVLMGLELILNAAVLNFISMSRYVQGGLSGQVVSIFIIMLAAAEAAVALAIVLNIYSIFRTVEVDEVRNLKE